MWVDFPFFFNSLLSSWFQVLSVSILSWFVCVCMFECVSMLVCMWFHWDLRKLCWLIPEESAAVSCKPWFEWLSPVLFTSRVCVQLQMTYICFNLLPRTSFPQLAQSFLLFSYKVFVFSQGERFTHHSWEGGKTEVPTCPVGKGRKNPRRGQKVVLSCWKRWLTWVDSGCSGT